MSACRGSYMGAIRTHPTLGAGECPVCIRRFDYQDLAGESKRNVPLHSAPSHVTPDAHLERSEPRGRL